MRTAFSLFLAIALVSPVIAHDDNTMGMFFSDSDFNDEARNHDTSMAAFNGYVVLLAPTVTSVGGYEVGIDISASSVFVLGATGPNGWTNFGGNLNHLVGYVTPLPAYTDGTVLCTIQMLYTMNQHVQIYFEESDPSSMSGMPVIADGGDPNTLIGCKVLGPDGQVASLNRPPPLTDDAKWTSVKSLFE